RAAFWLLDRDGIKGHYGANQITPKEDDEDEGEPGASATPDDRKGIGAVEVPDRWIYCLDLRDHGDHRVYVDEVKRIAAECQARRAARANASLVQLGVAGREAPAFATEKLLAQPGRRWYPVIDYSRCTNCMECLDF